MCAFILDNSTGSAPAARMLGTLVQHVGEERFFGALMAFCRDALGATDGSLLVHRGAEPELAGAMSVAGSRSRELGEWYMRGAIYRVEPSVEVARRSGAKVLLHSLRKSELPDSRWRDRYDAVGLDERVSLLVALDDGWAFMNAYRPPNCGVSMEGAIQAFGAQAPVLAAAVRRHLELVRPMATPEATGAAPHGIALSAREQQVVDAILAGASTKVCARMLGLSPTSVATYRQRAFDKLGIHRQVQLFQLMKRAN
jgi:DNA-binding CsgD family transcriptional regulator